MITMFNKRVLVLAFELLSLLLVIRVSAHAVGYSVDVFDGTTPVIDGELAPGEWNDASTLSFNFTIVHLKHDANNLYIAFNISDVTLDSNSEGVYIGLDTSNDGGPSFNQSDDIMIGTFRNGTAFETDGMGPLPPSPGWNVSVFEEAAGYTIEFNVTYGRIGITSGENKTLGLLLLSYDQSAFQYSIWPIMGMMDVTDPSNWGDMMVVFQTGPIYIKPDGSIEGSDKIVSMDNITYTFTSDINASIVVQRSNIVVDGEGWTLDGLNFVLMEGFNLTAVTNVTITNVNIERFASYSIYLKSASQCVISRNTVSGSEGGIGLFSSTANTVSDNTITGCSEGVELVSSSGNTISGNNVSDVSTGVHVFNSADNPISGNSVTDSGRGVLLYGPSNFNTIAGNNFTANRNEGIRLESSTYSNTISDNNLAMNDYGVHATNSSGNLISGNKITANGYSGIYLINSTGNTIWRNDITNNSLLIRGASGIALDMSSNNVLSKNNITANNWWGINPAHSHNNTIIDNIVIDNNVGLNFAGSTNNTISGNNIAGSIYAGIALDDASNNTFYHNNFVNNTNHAVVTPLGPEPTPNTWDNGFEGNYWSNYTGADANHDGIGDSPHVLDMNNTDNAPLMGPFNGFNTSLGKPVNVISNSTVEGFEYESPGTIRFSVSNMTENQTHGFCRVTIPHDVLSPPYTVTVNGLSPTHVNYTLHDNGTHSWIYFEYEHSTVEVVIIPEFPFFTILPLLMAVVSLATLVYRRKNI